MLRSSTYDTVIEMYHRTQADVDAHFEMHVGGMHFQPSTREVLGLCGFADRRA
jgi:hypothetical protein